jgi:hypothetical protein
MIQLLPALIKRFQLLIALTQCLQLLLAALIQCLQLLLAVIKC